VRRVFRLPLTTYTYLVEGHLACGFTPLRNVVLGNFVSFFQRLQDSPSVEVRMMADIAAGSAMTVTARNLSFVKEVTKLNARVETRQTIKKALPVMEVPMEEEWRLGLLDQLLKLRTEVTKEEKDTKCVVAMLASLCSS
jgi:hypothetical protein